MAELAQEVSKIKVANEKTATDLKRLSKLPEILMIELAKVKAANEKMVVDSRACAQQLHLVTGSIDSFPWAELESTVEVGGIYIAGFDNTMVRWEPALWKLNADREARAQIILTINDNMKRTISRQRKWEVQVKYLFWLAMQHKIDELGLLSLAYQWRITQIRDLILWTPESVGIELGLGAYLKCMFASFDKSGREGIEKFLRKS
ncbi:unnamed protein product [Discula destructiva]